MIYLLDTHSFIWSIMETNNLSKRIKEIIINKNNEICVSTISFWEISLKIRIKNFFFENINVNEFPKYARNMDFTINDKQRRII